MPLTTSTLAARTNKSTTLNGHNWPFTCKRNDTFLTFTMDTSLSFNKKTTAAATTTTSPNQGQWVTCEYTLFKGLIAIAATVDPSSPSPLSGHQEAHQSTLAKRFRSSRRPSGSHLHLSLTHGNWQMIYSITRNKLALLHPRDTQSHPVSNNAALTAMHPASTEVTAVDSSDQMQS